MQVDLSGKSALVTGASSGFGRHFAMTLARSGAHVTVAARRAALLDSLVDELGAIGATATALSLDVTNAVHVNKALSERRAFDIVVNNAGVAGPSRAIACDADEWRHIYDVNVHGAFFVARAAADSMIAKGVGGSIINIASITGERPGAAAAAYSSSKAAVAHMTRALATEWARHGIRVNAIAPGYFATDMTDEFLASDYGQGMMKRIPQRRFGEMSDLDGPLLLLASNASAYMTGAVLVVDGGHLVGPL
jgi:NAD(P)-dependent dehydrogenase (short-subunit alcohol dehydrogenase family)